MKKLFILIAAVFITLNLCAQTPQKMSYQAVIRNASNVLVTNAPVKMRISILQGSATGTSVYSELHSLTSNANGLVSLEIGGGTSPQGTFSAINWGIGAYFLKTETDPANGTNYSVVATSQLLSVPYALFSGNGIPGGGEQNQILNWCKGVPKWGPCLTKLKTVQPINITSISAVAGGIITDDAGSPVIERGVVWSVNPSPTIALPTKTSAGAGTGAYEISLTGLMPLTTYYVRAYATNSAGTSYGEEFSFVTLSPVPVNGEIWLVGAASLGGWNNPLAQPYITDQKFKKTAGNKYELTTLLKPNEGYLIIPVMGSWDTKYCLDDGVDRGQTVLGGDFVFKTSGGQDFLSPAEEGIYTITLDFIAFTFKVIAKAVLAKLSTLNAENITTGSAVISGVVNNDGGAAVTQRGFCWATTPNPTLANNVANAGNGIGSFSVNITGLASNTTYYVRSYAINSVGVAYSQELSFITLPDYPQGIVFCNDNPTLVVEVINPITNRIWMDRNLGASRAAISINDISSYGDLYQWGRRADGHQCRNSTTTTIASSTDQPIHNDFIINVNDWRVPQNINLWQGVNGINNPCPSGFRLPTEMELDAERKSWIVNSFDGAFNSPLKLPIGGARYQDGGGIFFAGEDGRYWSSTISQTGSRFLYFNFNSSFNNTTARAAGHSVRCIKN